MSDKNEIMIHYVIGEADKPEETFCHAHTHGLEKHNQLNLCLPQYLEENVAYEILDTVAGWIADNDNFDFRDTHVCRDADGTAMWAVKFGLIKCCGERCWLVHVLNADGEVDNSWMDNMHDDLQLLTKVEREAAAKLMGWTE